MYHVCEEGPGPLNITSMSLDVGEALYYVAESKVLGYCLVLLKRYLFFLNTFSLRIFYPNVFLPMSNIE